MTFIHAGIPRRLRNRRAPRFLLVLRPETYELLDAIGESVREMARKRPWLAVVVVPPDLGAEAVAARDPRSRRQDRAPRLPPPPIRRR